PKREAQGSAGANSIYEEGGSVCCGAENKTTARGVNSCSLRLRMGMVVPVHPVGSSSRPEILSCLIDSFMLSGKKQAVLARLCGGTQLAVNRVSDGRIGSVGCRLGRTSRIPT